MEGEDILAEFLDRVRIDSVFIEDHAQREFIAELLRPHSQATQQKLLNAYQQYLNTLRRDALDWRTKHKEGFIYDFLVEARSLALPPLRGGPRSKKESRLLKAIQDFDALKPCLKQKVKSVTGYRNPVARKLAIKEVVQKVLDTTDKIPEKKLKCWQSLPTGKIALQAAAWKNGIGWTYLERHIPRGRLQRIQKMLSDIGNLTRESDLLQTAIAQRSRSSTR